MYHHMISVSELKQKADQGSELREYQNNRHRLSYLHVLLSTDRLPLKNQNLRSSWKCAAESIPELQLDAIELVILKPGRFSFKAWIGNF